MNNVNRPAKDRRYLIGFSVAGSLISILFFAFINFSTGSSFPWFVFPAYAVLWWPLGTVFAGRHSMKVFSLIGSSMTIALLVFINYLTSWGYPWFLFPSFAILWWPLALFLGTRHSKSFSIVGSIVIIACLLLTNYITSPSVIWFYYPAFAVIWWPLSVLLGGQHTVKIYSIVGALLLTAFFTLENLLKSSFCPWALLTYFPILMWPLATLLGRRLGKLPIALFGSLAGILYYTILNVVVFPGFPWAIFPAYVLLWWPLAIAFSKRKHSMLFSVTGTLLSAALFITVNAVSSPNTIWAVYPIFALLWWPLSTYYFVQKRDTESSEPQNFLISTKFK